MKANEFVKEFGIEKAKLLLSTHGKTITELKGEYTAKQLKEYQGYIVSGDLMSFVELKRLVNSYKVVERCGGLEKALTRCYLGKHLSLVSYCRLKQAIEDVERCK